MLYCGFLGFTLMLNDTVILKEDSVGALPNV